MNDAEFGAFGEWVFGTGQDESYVFYIEVGTGVGAGFVINGHSYHLAIMELQVMSSRMHWAY